MSQTTMSAAARLVAIYLPQFHPTPENDKWWGRGFTEWTNVAKAKPLFKNHYQPRLPADLGFYDLRVPEVREAQAELARNAGIEAFCYYHYWFNGVRLLERPFNEVLASGTPDFPFCICWANHTWSGIWDGAPNRLLIEQTYPGQEDNQAHFMAVLDAFRDRRYLRTNGRPVFVIYHPFELPDVCAFIGQWQELAVQNGLPGIHFIAHLYHSELDWDYRSHGFESALAVNSIKPFTRSIRRLFLEANKNGSRSTAVPPPRIAVGGELRHWLWRRSRSALGQFSNVRLYRHALPFLVHGACERLDMHPCIVPNWDNTPRAGERGIVLHDSTPDLFRVHLRQALDLVQSKPIENRFVFIKSWNEWAEGNYLEPDQKFGLDYLKAIREELLGEQRARAAS